MSKRRTPRLSAAARKALDALPPKQQGFVLEYVETGNATGSARAMNYAHPDTQGPRLLEKVGVKEAIRLLREPVIDAKILSIEELREFWSSGTRGELKEVDRLRSSELLGKSMGAFVDRLEHSFRPPASPEEALERVEVLRRKLRGGSP